MSYTYDELSRVTKRTLLDLTTEQSTEEQFTYDAAGNITASGSTHCSYDTHNRLTAFAGNSLTYDAEGNLLKIHGTLSNTSADFAYDSSNRLIFAGNLAYTYNAEDVRIRAVNGTTETTYTYDTNARLSKLLTKTENGVTTKYVYGLGLIGEEKYYSFKTYHFDYRGSTVAITNSSGTVADRFQYDTYGKLISRTGFTDTPFLYNGRDGVMTDSNGLCYMRARYYSPVLRRFINADIVAGSLSDAITLNRYAYANGNPVSNIDPFGLEAERGWIGAAYYDKTTVYTFYNNFDLTFGLNLIKVSHKATATVTNTYKGSISKFIGAYAYKDLNVDLDKSQVGIGIDLLYLLGFDIGITPSGIEATLSFYNDLFGNDSSSYISANIDLMGDTSVSIGTNITTDDGIEINEEYSFEANTGLVLAVVFAYVTGQLPDFHSQSIPEPPPNVTTFPVPSYSN